MFLLYFHCVICLKWFQLKREKDTNLKLCHEHLLHRVQLKFLDALILEEKLTQSQKVLSLSQIN